MIFEVTIFNECVLVTSLYRRESLFGLLAPGGQESITAGEQSSRLPEQEAERFPENVGEGNEALPKVIYTHALNSGSLLI